MHDLTVFRDNDWASNQPTRKSASSKLIMLDGALISAGARTQMAIAQSSCVAMYIAATTATSEAKIQALFTACVWHVLTHVRSDRRVASRRTVTLSSSGCPLPEVAGSNCCKTCSSQQGTRARKRCRLKHATRRPTFARALSYVYGSDSDPETVS